MRGRDGGKPMVAGYGGSTIGGGGVGMGWSVCKGVGLWRESGALDGE